MIASVLCRLTELLWRGCDKLPSHEKRPLVLVVAVQLGAFLRPGLRRGANSNSSGRSDLFSDREEVFC